MRHKTPLLLLLVAVAVSVRPGTSSTVAQISVPIVAPNDMIDKALVPIGEGRVDDGINAMDGLKSLESTERDTVRNQMLQLRDNHGQNHGYDVVAVQRYSPRFMKYDVLMYYDQQPVLMRLHFYHPAADGAWEVLGLKLLTNGTEILEAMKDTPIDYPRHR